jgi:hypothetical protein
MPVIPESTSTADPGSGNGAHVPPMDAFRAAAEQVGELKAYASQYVAAKLDGVKLSIRRAVLYAALGVVGLIVAIGTVATAAALFVTGLAQAVSALLGGRAWAGNLIIGGGLLLIILGATWFVIQRMFKSSRKATVDRYEQRLQRQRVQHGHDARQRSAEYAQSH